MVSALLGDVSSELMNIDFPDTSMLNDTELPPIDQEKFATDVEAAMPFAP